MPKEYVVTHEEDLQPGLEIVTVSTTSESLPITYSIQTDPVAEEFFGTEASSSVSDTRKHIWQIIYHFVALLNI